MDAESFKAAIPDGSSLFYEESLDHPDPQWLDDEEAATEVFKPQVLNCTDGYSVIHKSSIQFISQSTGSRPGPLATSRRIGLAYIDWL
jgi:hypothetical protein